MKNVCLAGIALMLAAAAPASAFDAGTNTLVAGVRDSVKEWWKGLQAKPAAAPCLPGTHPVDEGEHGVVCRSDKPASVTCEILGYRDENEGELGVVRRPILGKCTPSGGWAGTQPIPGSDAPQAP